MGCNCGGSGARKQRGSAGTPSSARQQPGFWGATTGTSAEDDDQQVVGLWQTLRGSAAVGVTSPDYAAKLMTGGWQGQAYGYYDQLGEIHYAANFHARIGKLRFFIGRIDDSDEVTEVENSDLLGGLGDVYAIAETYGRQRFLGGESYAIEYVTRDEPGEVYWECLSPLECKRKDDTVELLGRPKVNGSDVIYKRVADDVPLAPGEAHLYRLWRSHPKNAYETDATMRAVLQDCERLRLERASDISEARSRIPAGVFVYPKRAFPPGPDDKPGETPKALKNLQESLVRPIRDLSDPSAQVPTMIGVDGSSQDQPQDVFRHMTFERRGGDDQTKEERCVVAIARGLDMPVEYLTGVGAVNHWGQWFIEDQLWKSHLQPLAQEFCREWTEIYLGGVTDDESLVIWYDETDIVAQPDKGSDAKDLFPLGAMTWQELRTSNGFKPDDGPDETERALIAEWLSSTRQQAPGVPGSGQDSGSTEQAPPSTNGASATVASVEGLAAYRAREVAGNRLINLARKTHPELLAALADCPRHQVACRVGRETAYALTGDPAPEHVLLSGSCATYAAWLAEQGIPQHRVDSYVASLLHGVAAELFDDSRH